jgi:hypothetical protein
LAGGRIFFIPATPGREALGMARRRWQAGWTRIDQNEFKAGVATALRAEPHICERLRRAIRATASRTGVRRDVRDQYLDWIAEVEAATGAMADAQQARSSQAQDGAVAFLSVVPDKGGHL